MPQKPFEIYWDKYKIVSFLIVPAVFLTVVIMICYYKVMDENTTYISSAYILGTAAGIFYGGMLFSSIKKLFDSKPALILTDEGIISRASYYQEVFVKWNEIKSVQGIGYWSNTRIILELYDLLPFVERQPSGLFRFLLKRKWLPAPPVFINHRILLCDYDDLKKLLEVKLEQHRGPQS